MFTHQFKLNQRGNRLASSSLWAVSLTVVLTIFLANSVTLPVLANSEEVKLAQFASNAAQIQQGEMELKEVAPAAEQISRSGSDLSASGTADHTGLLGKTGHTPDFYLKVAAHENEEWISLARDNQRGVQARTSNTGGPYIVANGVQMYEVNHAESGGWSTRAISDDTYGYGELIAVSVEFSESVRVDGETTFRISLDSGNRDLVPVSHRDETVIFAALIRTSDSDSNGVWIGDNTSTLGQNDADAIQSTGDSPRNAVLTHASLGTQSNHKVDGSKERPRLQSVRISSRPQHADAYVRGETVKIKARFDRPVTGQWQPVITSERGGSPGNRLTFRRLCRWQRHLHPGLRAYRHSVGERRRWHRDSREHAGRGRRPRHGRAWRRVHRREAGWPDRRSVQ